MFRLLSYSTHTTAAHLESGHVRPTVPLTGVNAPLCSSRERAPYCLGGTTTDGAPIAFLVAYRIDRSLVLDEVRRLCTQGAWVTAERVARSMGRLSEGDDIAASVRAVLDDLVGIGDLDKGPPPRSPSFSPGESTIVAYRPVSWR